MALAVSLKAVIMQLRTVVTEIQIEGLWVFSGHHTHASPACYSAAQMVSCEGKSENRGGCNQENITAERQSKEIELGEMRRMLLCVIVRTNWHLGSLICWQALHQTGNSWHGETPTKGLCHHHVPDTQRGMGESGGEMEFAQRELIRVKMKRPGEKEHFRAFSFLHHWFSQDSFRSTDTSHKSRWFSLFLVTLAIDVKKKLNSRSKKKIRNSNDQQGRVLFIKLHYQYP